MYRHAQTRRFISKIIKQKKTSTVSHTQLSSQIDALLNSSLFGRIYFFLLIILNFALFLYTNYFVRSM